MKTWIPFAAAATLGALGSRKDGRRNLGRGISRDRAGRGPVCRVAPWPAMATEADDQYCPVCDERYQDFRPRISDAQARAALIDWTDEARWDQEQSLSAGAIMQCKGALKQSMWRERHGGCEFAPGLDDFSDMDLDDLFGLSGDAGEWRKDRKGRKRLYGAPRELSFEKPKPIKFWGRKRLPTGGKWPKNAPDCRTRTGKFKRCPQEDK